MSLGWFAWETLKRWWLSVVGVGFAAVGVVQVVFGASVSLPTPVAFGGAALTWFLAAGWAYHDLRTKQGPSSAVWQALAPLMHQGADLLERLHGVSPMGDWMGDAERWARNAADEIERLTDQTEAALFRAAGKGQHAEAQVQAKIEYLRDRLQPKAIEGFWS